MPKLDLYNAYNYSTSNENARNNHRSAKGNIITSGNSYNILLLYFEYIKIYCGRLKCKLRHLKIWLNNYRSLIQANTRSLNSVTVTYHEKTHAVLVLTKLSNKSHKLNSRCYLCIQWSYIYIKIMKHRAQT